MRLVNIVTRRHIKRILYQKTQTQRALRSSGLFWTATAKAVVVNCRPPDYTARGGLHIADGAEPWCGPARRPANPCVARTSGAPSRALFHSPVPGPVHVTDPIFGPCALAPPAFVARSCTHADGALESRRAHRARRMGAATTHFPPNRLHRQPTSAPLDVRIPVFSAGLGGKGESADRTESRPRSTIVPRGRVLWQWCQRFGGEVP